MCATVARFIPVSVLVFARFGYNGRLETHDDAVCCIGSLSGDKCQVGVNAGSKKPGSLFRTRFANMTAASAYSSNMNSCIMEVC